MNAKRMAESIKVELSKMLENGFIDESQHEVIKNMIDDITETQDNPHVEYNDDRKYAYFNGHKYYRNKNGYFSRMEVLHKAVYEFYNGNIPNGYEIHHNYKDENGNWDNSNNDIEYLKMMTSEEHKKLHGCPMLKEKVLLICPVCGKKFIKQRATQIYCCRKCTDLSKYMKNVAKPIKRKCEAPDCNEEFETTKASPRKYCDKHYRGKGIK